MDLGLSSKSFKPKIGVPVAQNGQPINTSQKNGKELPQVDMTSKFGQMFHKFDTNKSGTLDRAQAKAFLHEYYKKNGWGKPSLAEVNEVFAKIDSDSSGQIDFMELTTFLHKQL